MNRPAEFPALNEASEICRADLRCRARRALKLRHFREQLFGRSISKEVAWNMLLVLYAVDRRMTIGRLTKAAHASQTTGLRWLDYLEDHHLIRRTKSPMDSRAVLISLTDAAEQLMDSYMLETIGNGG